MEYSSKDLISPREVLSEVLVYTGESRYENVTKGFIISQMNKCMMALSYHTFFDERHEFFDMPSTATIEIPSGVFNIKNIYIYNGNECNIGVNTKNVYWKRDYFTNNGTMEFAKNSGKNVDDPFYQSYFNSRLSGGSRSDGSLGSGVSDNLYFYNEANGLVMLSPGCLNFSKIMIEFNGIWQIDESKASIPLMFQEVLVDWCTEAVFRAKLLVNPQAFRTLQMDAVMRLGYKPETFDGSWYKAKKLATQMGSKAKEDLKEYLTRLNS